MFSKKKGEKTEMFFKKEKKTRSAEAQLTGTLDLTNMPTTDNLATEGWAWNANTRVLTLDGLSLHTTSDRGIILPENSSINLIQGGINTVEVENASPADINYGIFSTGTFNIDGNGTLNVNVNQGFFCHGIHSDRDINILGGIINSTAGESSRQSVGIFAIGTIRIGTDVGNPNNPIVTAISINPFNPTTVADSVGIYANQIIFRAGTTTGESSSGNGINTAFYTTNSIILENEEVVVFPVGANLSTLDVDLNRVVRDNGGSGDRVLTSVISRAAVVTCSSVAHRDVELCVPVSVRPFANTGNTIVRCCGLPIIGQLPDGCRGVPGGTCNFNITQRICVEVPVQFGAETTTGETFVLCAEAIAGACINCPQIPEGEV